MEAFALAPDRKKVLEQLVPGTEDYYYYSCLHHEQTGNHTEVQRLLAQWSQQYGETVRAKAIRDRQGLLTWEQDPAGRAEQLRLRLGITFTHQKESASKDTQRPSSIDPRWIDRDAFAAKSITPDLRQCGESSFAWLLQQPQPADRLRLILQRLRHPDYANLAALVAQDLKEKNSGGFGSLQIHSALLRAQLDALAQLLPELRTNVRFVETYLTKLRPSAEEPWESFTPARQDYLERLWSYVQSLPVTFNTIKAHVLYHRLDLDRRAGRYERERFLAYLSLPRPGPYARDTTLQDQSALVNLHVGVQSAKLGAIGNDEPLVSDYLRHFFRAGEDFAPFAPLIGDHYLKPLYAETRLLYAVGDLEACYPLLGDPSALQRLKERVEIAFSLTNKEHYLADESVHLDLEVKNVETLVVKIFQINTLNFFLEHGRDVNTGIDLDGLVPALEETHHYPEPALRKVPRRLDLPALQKPGVYVVELIGNGRSSRAIIRKGALRYVSRTSAAGHVLHVIDEKDRVVESGSIFVAGRELSPKADGAFYLPFTSEPAAQRPLLLRHGGIDTIVTFKHDAEHYSFAAGVYVDRESLIAGKEAPVLVRPTLMQGEAFLPLELLEELRLTIETTDRQGTTSSKELPAESFSFQCPPQLARVSFTVRAKVRSVSTGRHVDVSDGCSYTCNDIDATTQVEALHLARTDGGYVAYLLGKTGEPCANRLVNVALTHRDFESQLSLGLQTDAEGRLQLGPLTHITAIVAWGAPLLRAEWTLALDRVRSPSLIHGAVGQSVSIPMVSDDYWILETRAGTFVRDVREHTKLSDGFLVLTGLSAGDYVLGLRDRQIRISITGGVRVGSWWLHQTRQLEAPRAPPLHIAKIDVGKEQLVVRVANAGAQTRVHVIGSRFVPAYDCFAAMTRCREVTLGQKSQTLVPSHFVSGRDIGDEYRYILDRKAAKKYAGVLQARPGLLLNPWPVRKTQTSVQAPSAGGAFADSEMERGGPRSGAPMPQASAAASASNPFFSNLDFLAHEAVVMLSLAPSADGTVSLPRASFATCNQVRVVAVDGAAAVCRDVALSECRAAHADKRLLLALDPQQPQTEKKQTTVLSAGSSLDVADITTSKVEAYDSLAKVHNLFSALSKNALLRTFSFVVQWHKLSESDRAARYSEYACHELSFFVSRKDPAFFQRVVTPYLANKKDKTFLDHYLLGADLSGYLRLWAYLRLNVVERILLAGRLRAEGEPTARHLADKLALLPVDLQRRALLFSSAIGRSALDTEDAFGMRQSVERSMADASIGLGAMASAMPPPPPAAAAPMMRRARQSRDEKGDMGGGNDLVADLQEREASRPFFQPLDKTEEWAENNYYQLPLEGQGAGLVTVNAFWRDFAALPAGSTFFSASFPEASNNFTEMMFALSVLDLPFEAQKPEATFAGKQMRYLAKSASIVFHQEIKAALAAKERAPVLVSQNYFRLDDRYRTEDGEQRDKYVTGELLTRTAYQCQVVLTNPTSARQKLELLLQIPKGSMPVQSGFETKGLAVHLEPYATRAIDYSFYFPLPGEFTHYPANVTKNEALSAAAPATVLKVVSEPSSVDHTSWAHVSQHGSEQEVLRFLNEQNVDNIELTAIAWRMRERTFFTSAIQVLASRHVYDHTLWSYGLFHRDLPLLNEYLQHCDAFIATLGPVLSSPPLEIDSVTRGAFEHFEYAPLINARVHKLGAERKILNDRLLLQYTSLMQLFSHKAALHDDDWIVVAYYLFLQDRHEDGLAALRKAKRDRVSTKLQHDYLTVHAAQLVGNTSEARAIAAQHADHPITRWRELFKNVVHQIDEASGASAQVLDERDRDQRQGALASAEPSFDFKVEARTITLHYRNLRAIQVSYYAMDIELLFSRQPFVQQDNARFSFITPNHTETIALPTGQSHLSLDVPDKFKSANLIVELSAQGVRKSQSYFAHSLSVQMLEAYGQVAVSEQGTGKPMPKTYVKVYARMNDGSVQFFKDGYTDVRGRMDYASLSTNDLDRTDRFSLLIMSDEHGAVVREAAPPKR